MKNLNVKLMAVLMLFIAASMNLNAQNEPQDSILKKEMSFLDHRHELNFGVGFLSLIPNYNNASMYPWYNASDGLIDVIGAIFGSVLVPSVSVSYDYRINKLLAVGGLVSSDFEWFHSAMVKMKFYYIANPKFSFYGDLGLGVTLSVNQFTNTKATPQLFPNFGVYPIGVKFGKKAGGFVELGYGYKGFMNFGGFVKF
ncbi:MAG: hypothetical protein PHR53_02015 [Bacteroidales bacterium]|nr:hypothetical protein [Bacteroidales bacterium]